MTGKKDLLAQKLRDDFHGLYRADEEACVRALLHTASLSPEAMAAAQARAADWARKIRAERRTLPGVNDLLGHFGLSTQEGIALMCLAEALLRIPDRATADTLIRDKLSAAEWDDAIGGDDRWLMNATGWTLSITGKISNFEYKTKSSPGHALGALVTRLGQPVIREAIRAAMHLLANQFVLGSTIETAIERGNKEADARMRYSFDMLGEGARTMTDADTYTEAYVSAIKAVGAANRTNTGVAPSGISVKLSALHPRYEAVQYSRVMSEMVPRLAHLAELAAAENVFMLVDAEEADRLALSLDVIDAVMGTAKIKGWEGFGAAVQAYQKRTPATIDMLASLSELHRQRLVVRLIKGAYWDTEIKRAQERGWSDFPVFTRKVTTDVSYLACAARLLEQGAWLQPVFGSHNALTVASIIEMAPEPQKVEFQRLHGMGDALYDLLHKEGYQCCVYAPVGGHETLLSYLVRRLLENGANSSFVHRIHDPKVSIDELTTDPVAQLAAAKPVRHPVVKMPETLYEPDRRNSAGIDLTDPVETAPLLADMAKVWAKTETASKITPEQLENAISEAQKGYGVWSNKPVAERAQCLERLADLLEKNRAMLMAVLVREGGKTINDALAELREAADFCRYYAVRAVADFKPRELPGPTGERNVLSLHGRGVFVCISPWNFPLAIFIGQVVAALAAGNSVLAKPASQTPLIARHAVRLTHDAGVPQNVLQLIIGSGEVGTQLVNAPVTAGVAFTGSVATARKINRTLAAKDAPIVPLIAETGGQNAMIVDTSALPEQVVDDIITSAFRSAGQRCSALRVLFLPEPTADGILTMLKGAMQALVIGDPGLLSTDIGPVIDSAAQEGLLKHVERLRHEAHEIFTCALPPACAGGNFVAPQAWLIKDITWLKDEVFGPILHVVRYNPVKLAKVVAGINATGFGLTGGIHSRIEQTVSEVAGTLRAGNLYVNRSMIGAIVGSQPFGGEGLSGTGPKAGGPHYLPRFALERVTSINTTAAGGNASLLAAMGDG
ncbi:MAG: L-glutamate gamma-semialdehyde dehydrogenase [Alphaproteobacteria bacterium]|nr:L-glutamate gamma-semialdehyde dehydrogenase [Alphaproteobacteria bacterium]